MEHKILLPGDDQGHNAILEYQFPNGIKINAVGVPQSWDTPLGPTWSYIIEHDELTVIDPGCYGTITSLKDGLEYLGHSLESVGSVIISHGLMSQVETPGKDSGPSQTPGVMTHGLRPSRR